MNISEKLIEMLFKTNALKVSEYNKPFWYTSGKIGPYYINTHFLYGNELVANELLNTINEIKDNIIECPGNIMERVLKNYNENEVYKELVNIFTNYIKESIDINEIDYVSGGERRDWFFSFIVAEILNKPHITIYKNKKCVLSKEDRTFEPNNISGNVLHVADLLNEASSFDRVWIPAIKNIGTSIKWSVVVVNRCQGGDKLLNGNGIKSFSTVKIDKTFFGYAKDQNYISDKQYLLIESYIKNPFESMREFILKNKNYLEETINLNTKDSKRAMICKDKNLYKI